MYPKLSVIGGLLVAILDLVVRPPSPIACCYQCSVPGAACWCLLSLEGLLGGFGERHYNAKTKSLRGTLLVRLISLWTPSLVTVSVPTTHSFSAYSSSIRVKKQLLGVKVCSPTFAFSPQKGPTSLLKLPKSHVPDPHQHCWLQEWAAFILALLATTSPPKKWISILF